MGWKKALVIAALAAAALLGGCITHTAAPATEGKAYVMDGSIFGTGMLYCDASDGNPECWPVSEQERE
ncbi:MAG: hypothetical protein R6V85_10350 [Polyangia bacterium]